MAIKYAKEGNKASSVLLLQIVASKPWGVGSRITFKKEILG